MLYQKKLFIITLIKSIFFDFFSVFIKIHLNFADAKRKYEYL